MIKTLNELGVGENFLYLIKGISEKTTADIMLSGETPNLSPKISKKTRMSTHHFHSALSWRFQLGQLGKKNK